MSLCEFWERNGTLVTEGRRLSYLHLHASLCIFASFQIFQNLPSLLSYL